MACIRTGEEELPLVVCTSVIHVPRQAVDRGLADHRAAVRPGKLQGQPQVDGNAHGKEGRRPHGKGPDTQQSRAMPQWQRRHEYDQLRRVCEGAAYEGMVPRSRSPMQAHARGWLLCCRASCLLVTWSFMASYLRPVYSCRRERGHRQLANECHFRMSCQCARWAFTAAAPACLGKAGVLPPQLWGRQNSLSLGGSSAESSRGLAQQSLP